MHLMMWCACEEKAKQTGNKQTTRKESIEESGRVLERPGEIWKDLERFKNLEMCGGSRRCLESSQGGI